MRVAGEVHDVGEGRDGARCEARGGDEDDGDGRASAGDETPRGVEEYKKILEGLPSMQGLMNRNKNEWRSLACLHGSMPARFEV